MSYSKVDRNLGYRIYFGKFRVKMVMSDFLVMWI